MNNFRGPLLFLIFISTFILLISCSSVQLDSSTNSDNEITSIEETDENSEDPDTTPSIGNDSIDAGIGTGDGPFDMMTTLNHASLNTLEALENAILGGDGSSNLLTLSKNSAKLFYQIIDCNNSGDAVFSGHVILTDDELTADFDFVIKFESCDGINGSLDVISQYSLSDNQIFHDITYKGDIGGNGCLINYDGFQIKLTKNTTSENSSYIYYGKIEGTCEEQVISCDFEQGTADLETDGICF